MDPDETLHELREYATKADEHAGDPALFHEMGKLFDALDGWLSGGGFLPGAWREGGEDHR